jgi:predicted nucleotide-binding protein
MAGTSKPTEYWNAIITRVKSGKSPKRDVVVVDKDLEWIKSRILQPRLAGDAITVDGHTLDWSEIERIRITVAQEPSEAAIVKIHAEDRASSVARLGGPGDKWRAAARARDVTDDFIDAPPGSPTPTANAVERDHQVDPRRVMVVYGRDGEARRAMFDYLRALDLVPGEWRKLVAETEKATPYVGEVLDLAFQQARAVVVLLTPDDEAKLRDGLMNERDQDYERELTPQARPNVLFEAGMAFGIHPDRVVLVELGTLRPFSDVFGRHVVRLGDDAGPLREIASRLKAAGCAVNEDGDDWADPKRFPRR